MKKTVVEMDTNVPRLFFLQLISSQPKSPRSLFWLVCPEEQVSHALTHLPPHVLNIWFHMLVDGAAGDYDVVLPQTTSPGFYKIRVGLFGDDAVYACSEAFEIVEMGDDLWA